MVQGNSHQRLSEWLVVGGSKQYIVTHIHSDGDRELYSIVHNMIQVVEQL